MSKEPKLPFFARLLEAQQLDQIKTELKAGARPITLKYPSDDDQF